MSHIDELKWKTIKAGKMKSLLVERICEMNIGLSFLNRPQIDLCFRYWSGRRVIDGCNIDVTASAAGMYGGTVLSLIELAWASGSMSVSRGVYPPVRNGAVVPRTNAVPSRESLAFPSGCMCHVGLPREITCGENQTSIAA